ncbi:ABC transporter substrate-binding protein [Clostridium sp. BSD9I1]|uniref:ABC transporter substrate-binding protein n=1 Tax=Clostridium sp. BSD9I1 TaxID=2003589 RepID=UPI001644AFA8|nr:ABC transporter substrate-binding protein [Clostridium sp. BSD9I1]
MKIFNKFIIGTIIVSSLLGFTACGNKTAETTDGKKTVKIAYLPLTHAVPLYVEHEDPIINKEDLKNVNIELVKYGSWPELMDALSTGKVDGASVLVQFAMKAKAQGIGLKAVALGHRDGTNITVAKDINSISDLKGKTIAIPQRFSTMNILLYQMLEDEGMSYSDVKTIELAPAEMPAALSEGRISAYIVAEPFGATSVINGKGKTLIKSEDIWENSICCAFVLRDEFINNNKEAAEEVVNGYVKAGEKAEAKDENIQKIASKYMSVKKEVLDLSLKSTVYTDLKINEKDYEKLTSYLRTMKLLENPPKYSDFVDNSLINKAE